MSDREAPEKKVHKNIYTTQSADLDRHTYRAVYRHLSYHSRDNGISEVDVGCQAP
jgi:hypothetical protein